MNTLSEIKIKITHVADGFDQWQSVATDAQRQGLNVKTSSLIENFASSEQAMH
jgi:hypothetical protein